MCQETICVPFVDTETAEKIMGRNYIGLDDIAEHSDIIIFQEDREFFSRIPYSQALLEQCQHTHILIPGFPLGVLDIFIKVPESHFHFDSDPWWISEKFTAERKMEKRWYLIRRNVLPGSAGKSYEDQTKMVVEHGEDIPMGCELIYAIVFYYLVTGIRLFGKIKAHCKDIYLDGVNFHVGFFSKGHIDVRGYANGNNKENIGISSMKNPLPL